MKDFAGFLARAEEYTRTGLIPVQAKAARAPRTPKPKVPAITLDEAKRLVEALYERSISDDVTYEHITAEVQRLDKLTAKDLTEAAKHFGVVPGKTKKASLDAILEKITPEDNARADSVLTSITAAVDRFSPRPANPPGRLCRWLGPERRS